MSEEGKVRKPSTAEPVARSQIRRFDVFAEYNRLRNEARGMSPSAAKGEALWLAKVVAARKYATTVARKAEYNAILSRKKPSTTPPGGVKTLEGKPQTAELFDREIIARMGPEFYERIFSPAIEHAYQAGEKYEQIRDRLRTEWNLRRRAL